MRQVMMLLVAIALAAACRRPAEEPGTALPAGEWRSFEGTWTAAGDRRAIDAAPGQQASVVDFSGSILLTGERGIGAGFQARAIAYSDGKALSVGRAVWTDERGDMIFSELSGGQLATGRRITGTFTGGTGRWSGIAGEYGFDWKYVIDTETRVQGRAEQLRGRARIAESAVGPR
jgi:hypothetical protein